MAKKGVSPFQALAVQNKKLYIVVVMPKGKSKQFLAACVLLPTADALKTITVEGQEMYLVGFNQTLKGVTAAGEFLRLSKAVKGSVAFVGGRVQELNPRFLNSLSCYAKSLQLKKPITYCVRTYETDSGRIRRHPCRRAMGDGNTKDEIYNQALYWESAQCPNFDIDHFEDQGPAPKKFWND